MTRVERVHSYKYLGTVLDDTLSRSQNTSSIISKTNTRLYCLRKLNTFHVSTDLLQLFFSSVVCSVLTFGGTCWGGNITQGDKDKIDRLIRKGGRVVGKTQDSLTDMYNDRLYKK